MRTLRALLLTLPVTTPLLAQTDNTVYVKTFHGSTVGEIAAPPQAACNPALRCIVVFDPSLNYFQGTMPTPCTTCVWEDYRVSGTFSITENLYANGTLISGSSGGGTGNSGTLAAPTFSPAGGIYSSAQSVTIGLPPGAIGCYTVDGSTPVAPTAGTCTQGYSYSSPVTVATSGAISALASEVGWTNSSVASAVYTINSFLTYSDKFMRANGPLGANWTEARGGNGTLQIINDAVYAATPGVVHSIEIYASGTFGNNQWSSITLGSGTGSSASGSATQFAAVRGSPVSKQYYNDGVAAGSGFGGLLYRVGNPAGNDFCATQWAGPAYVVGDMHEFDVAGTGPVFFWSKHNGVIDASCVDTTYNYTGGKPGLGAVDPNSVPTLAVGPWQGGTLPSFSTTSADNFQRPNAGWLGVNWWFAMTGGQGSGFNSYFVLRNNAAVVSVNGGDGVAVWTTPLTLNHSSKISIGNLANSDWLGAVARYTIPANGVNESSNAATDTFYLALDVNGIIDLFAYDAGSWVRLASLGTYSGPVSTIELDAVGISPVTLTVKINGTQFGTTYADSTYDFTGAYAGFAAAATTSSTVTRWTGANL